jgi:spore germination protein
MDLKNTIQNALLQISSKAKTHLQSLTAREESFWTLERKRAAGLALLGVASILVIGGSGGSHGLLSPLSHRYKGNVMAINKSGYEVFGFAPYWNINKLDQVDFGVLTTFAYFGVPVKADGSLNKNDVGYTTFKGKKARELFDRANAKNSKVVLTITLMNNSSIERVLDSEDAQNKVIKETIAEVKEERLQGVNIDFEYSGNPGATYQDKFSKFVATFTEEVHKEIPDSQLSVSVYASAAMGNQLYDISSIGRSADLVFMMAYDFAVAGSDNAIPTAPLYGHSEGKYWYDIDTAVGQFLGKMDGKKLVLGTAWYGYNHAVSAPEVKAATQKGYYITKTVKNKKGKKVAVKSYVAAPKGFAQTYQIADKIDANMEGITDYQEGWDDAGKVGWKAYKKNGTWRMVFAEDTRSLAIKYDYAKERNLGGVGAWALGFEGGKQEMWDLLREKFGAKLADRGVSLN